MKTKGQDVYQLTRAQNTNKGRPTSVSMEARTAIIVVYFCVFSNERVDVLPWSLSINRSVRRQNLLHKTYLDNPNTQPHMPHLLHGLTPSTVCLALLPSASSQFHHPTGQSERNKHLQDQMSNKPANNTKQTIPFASVVLSKTTSAGTR